MFIRKLYKQYIDQWVLVIWRVKYYIESKGCGSLSGHYYHQSSLPKVQTHSIKNQLNKNNKDYMMDDLVW